MKKANIGDAIQALCPGAAWQLLGNDYADLEWMSTAYPKPSQKQVDDKIEELNIEYAYQTCKEEASALLYATDWTTIPDVADIANSPYLTNQAEFIAWRSQVRALAVNPIIDPVFPPTPEPVWG
jgi:hypothetical protein